MDYLLGIGFNYPLSTTNMDEGPALGSAILAGVGVRICSSVEEACPNVIKVTSSTAVIQGNVAIYARYCKTHQSFYPAFKDSSATLTELDAS